MNAVSRLIVLFSAGLAFSQELPVPTLQSGRDPNPFQSQSTENAGVPCVQPAPLPALKDYEGPLGKTIGVFARALERKSIHQPHYKPGVTLCSLELDDKFLLFIEDSIDPVTFLGAGFDAAIDQASNRDPAFGQGAAGYGKRFGADLADRVSSGFFLRTSPTRRYSPKIPGTIAWGKAAPANAFFTQPDICS